MKLLPIKQLYQKEKSLDCGPVCVQMILEYFGIKKELSEIIAVLDYDQVGTTIFQNAQIFIQNNIKTVNINNNPLLFSYNYDKLQANKDNFQKMTNTQVLELINQKKEKLEKYSKTLGEMEDYLKNGGQINIKTPQFSEIKSAIDENKPIIALVFSYREKGIFHHFVIVNGYDTIKDKNDDAVEMVFVTDPSKMGKTGWFPASDFIFWLHASTLADIDNGSLLIVG